MSYPHMKLEGVAFLVIAAFILACTLHLPAATVTVTPGACMGLDSGIVDAGMVEVRGIDAHQ